MKADSTISGNLNNTLVRVRKLCADGIALACTEVTLVAETKVCMNFLVSNVALNPDRSFTTVVHHDGVFRDGFNNG